MPSLLSVYTHWGGEPRCYCTIYSLILFVVVILDLQAILPAQVVYILGPYSTICSKLSIIHKTTSPYTPEHNGIAERYNRTLQEGALTLQHDSELTSKFWVSAIHTVNFIRNRVLRSWLGISPYEALWGTKPKIDWLCTYGCKCWTLIPNAIRKKGEYQSVQGL